MVAVSYRQLMWQPMANVASPQPKMCVPLTSSSNPRSTILSASSRHRYLKPTCRVECSGGECGAQHYSKLVSLA